MGKDTYHIMPDNEQSIYHLVECNWESDWNHRIAGVSVSTNNGKTVCLTGIKLNYSESDLHYVPKNLLVSRAINLHNNGKDVCRDCFKTALENETEETA